MPNYREIYLNLYGVWRLLHLDEAAMGWFDSSVEGFWKSFFAALLVAPAYVLLLAIRPIEVTGTESDASAAIIFGAHAVTYVFLWVVWPLAALSVTDLMGRSDRYLRYMVAYNWATVWQYGLLVTLALVSKALGGNPILVLAGDMAILAFLWYLTRTALAISGFAAAGLIGLDIFLSILIQQMKNYMLL